MGGAHSLTRMLPKTPGVRRVLGFQTAWILSAVFCSIRCKPNAEKAEPTAGSAATGDHAAGAAGSAAPPLAGERVEVPGGTFRSGSRPGEPGRKPEVEPQLVTVELGPFLIDRLPYPNDPAEPPLTGVPRDRAARLCAERGSRLCTELEWERACKGPQSSPYSTGVKWDPACVAYPARCASGFDVLGLGALREWTASNVIPETGGSPHPAAVRGAAPKDPGPVHRCARRRALDPDSESPDLAFRCCKGPPNAAKVKEPREGQTFEKVQISAATLEKALAASPHTRAIAHDIQFFREPDAANTVIDRGPGDRKGFLFTVSPLRWNPVAGMDFLVVAARSGKETSFVAVFFVIDHKEYELASSFVMVNEPGPVALAYNGYIRPRLHFSTCWGCPGETGKILYRDPDAALILQP